MTPIKRFFPIILVLILSSLNSLFGQDDPIKETEDDLEFLEETIRDGYVGAYKDAVEGLEEYLEDFPRSMRALEGLTSIERMRGNYAESLKAAEKWVGLAPFNANALVEQAKTLSLMGRYDPAIGLIRSALKKNKSSLKARFHLADLLYKTGRRDEAKKLAKESVIIQSFNDLSGEEKVFLSQLYAMLNELEYAAEAAVYGDLDFNGKKGRNYDYERFEALLALGDIFRRTRLGTGGADKGSGNCALSCYRDALKVNRFLPEAHLGLAHTRFYVLNTSKAMNHLDNALEANPVHYDSLALKAHILIISRNYSTALELIQKGLAQNPNEKGLIGMKAAIHFFKGENEAYEEAIKKAHKVDRFYGEVFFRMGEQMIFHYRFPEAEQFARKCLEVDPDYSEAYILLGRALANLGREDEAKLALQKSMKLDPFNYPWRKNMLQVLSDLETFLEVNNQQFKMKIDVDEANIMRHFLPKWGDLSLKLLKKRYGYETNEKILLEMFPENQDFAVRTIGFTGFGALGACFGKVVTLLSPKVKQMRGQFSWVSTLHHELCHVFTLEESNYRIPRWLTEGISVYEEEMLNPNQRRNMDMELFVSYFNEALFSLKNFNQGFMGPRVLFAYYQGGLTVKYIVERYGIEALLKMVRAYGKDLSTNGVLKRVLNTEVEEFDIAFKQWLWDNLLSKVKLYPIYGAQQRSVIIDDLKLDPKNPEKLIRAAWACAQNNKNIDALYYLNKLPKNLSESKEVILIQARIAHSQGNNKQSEAYYKQAIDLGADDLDLWRHLADLAAKKDDMDLMVEYLKKAKACFPSYITAGSPCQMLIQIYQKQKKEDEAVQEMEHLIHNGLVDISMVLKAGEYYFKKDNLDKAKEYLEEAVRIDPFQREIHTALGKVNKDLMQYNHALEAFDAALLIHQNQSPPLKGNFFSLKANADLNSVLADIHVERAETLMEISKKEEALEAIEKALLLKSDHSKAIQLREDLKAKDN